MSFPVPPQIFYPSSFPYLLLKKSSSFWKAMQTCWKKSIYALAVQEKESDHTRVSKPYVG